MDSSFSGGKSPGADEAGLASSFPEMDSDAMPRWNVKNTRTCKLTTKELADKLSNVHTDDQEDDTSQSDNTTGKRKNATSRSSAKRVSPVVGKFCDTKIRLLRKIGFEDSVHIPGITKMDRAYTVDLMMSVDCDKRELQIDANTRIKLGDEDVKRIFSIPCGRNKVHGIDSDEPEDTLDFIRLCIGTRGKDSYNSLEAAESNVTREYSHPMSKEEEENFQVSFVVWIMNRFYTPTCQPNTGCKTFWGALEKPDKIAGFNWCAHVLDGTIEAARKAQYDMAAKKFVANVGGCPLLLQVAALDFIRFEGRQAPPRLLPAVADYNCDIMAKLIQTHRRRIASAVPLVPQEITLADFLAEVKRSKLDINLKVAMRCHMARLLKINSQQRVDLITNGMSLVRDLAKAVGDRTDSVPDRGQVEGYASGSESGTDGAMPETRSDTVASKRKINYSSYSAPGPSYSKKVHTNPIGKLRELCTSDNGRTTPPAGGSSQQSGHGLPINMQVQAQHGRTPRDERIAGLVADPAWNEPDYFDLGLEDSETLIVQETSSMAKTVLHNAGSGQKETTSSGSQKPKADRIMDRPSIEPKTQTEITRASSCLKGAGINWDVPDSFNLGIDDIHIPAEMATVTSSRTTVESSEAPEQLETYPNSRPFSPNTAFSQEILPEIPEDVPAFTDVRSGNEDKEPNEAVMLGFTTPAPLKKGTVMHSPGTLNKLYSETGVFFRLMEPETKININCKSLAEEFTDSPIQKRVCPPSKLEKSPWSKGIEHPKRDPTLTVKFYEWLATTDGPDIERPWIMHNTARYLEVTGTDLKNVFCRGEEMSYDLFDLAIRRLIELDEKMYMNKQANRWRHLMESDFAMLAIALEDTTDTKSIRNQWIGNSIKHAIQACRMVTIPALVRKTWCAYFWDMKLKRVHVLDPQFKTNEAAYFQELHKQNLKSITHALTACAKMFFHGWCPEWESWEPCYVAPRLPNVTSNESGITTLRAILEFNGATFVTGTDMDSPEQMNKWVLYEVLCLSGNCAKLPGCFVQCIDD